MRKLLLVIFILLVTFPAYAQSENLPIAIVLDSLNHDLIAINSDGTQQIYDLPVPENAYIGGTSMTISPNANYVAFCWGLYDNPESGSNLSVLDLTTNSVIIEHEYGNIMACNATAFNTTNTQLAVATVTSSPAYTPGAEAIWALAVYDVASGEVVHELGTRPEFEGAFPYLEGDVPLGADVQFFHDDVITFAAIPYVGMGGVADVPAFAWNVRLDTVASINYMGKLLGDNLPTGEVVFPALNENFNAAMPDGPLPQANEAHFFDGENEHVVYRNEDWTIIGSHFIDNGEKLALLLLEDVEDVIAAGKMSSAQRVVIIERDGTVTELPANYENYAQIGNTPDGAVILWSEMPADGTPPPISHLRVVHADNTTEDIWAYQPELNERGYTFLELVWTQAIISVESRPAFPTV